MSTQINLTIGDQRLLQANKTRTAANQQALDDRTASKQLEQKATEAAEAAAPEEQPGALPDTSTRRRPAAQRKPKQGAGLLLFDNVNFKLLNGSRTDISTNPQISLNLQSFVNGDFVYSRVFGGITNRVTYVTINNSPIVYTFDPPENTPTGVPTPQYTTSTVFDAYNVFYSVFSSSWRVTRKASLLIGTGNSATRQIFVDQLGAFPLPTTISSGVSEKIVVHSSTIDTTYVSYAFSYFSIDVGEYTANNIGDPIITPSSIIPPPVGGLTYTYIRAFTATLNTIGIYFQTDHQTGVTTYRVQTLDTTVYPVADTRTSIPPIGFISSFSYPFTSQQQQDFIANMSVDDPRRIMYQQTSRLDYALDTAINGCMYNPDTGGMYVTAFDKNYEKVFVAKATVNRGLTYAAALLEQAKPAALAIKNNSADIVPAALTAPFTLYSQFINTLGPDTTFPAGLGKFYVMFGT